MMTDRIEKQIVLHAPRARVWRAISDASEFGSWFGLKVEGAFRPKTRVRAQIVPTTVDEEVAKQQQEYVGYVFEIQVEEMQPERRLSFRWHPYAIEKGVDFTTEPTTLVVFELEDVDGGVLLKLTESGFDRLPAERRAKAFTANEQGWTLQMTMIEKYLAHAA